MQASERNYPAYSFYCTWHYGLLSTARREQLRQLQLAFGIDVPKVKEKKNWKDICREHLNYNPDICPQCGKGRMVTMEMFPAGRPPPVVSSALFESFVNFNNL